MKFLKSLQVSIYSVYAALAVLILVLIGGSYYISSIKAELALEQTVDLSVEIEEVFGAYATYENAKYGYIFEYPRDWVLDETNPERIALSVSGPGSKTIYIDHPYADGALEGQDFLTWAGAQSWPFEPLTVEEYFDEIVIPSGIPTYKRANSDQIHTVIVPVNDEVLYVRRVDGSGEGNIEGEDIYFHLLNSFNTI